jgi:DNA-binding PadR family transcriptional regulator
MKLLHDQLEALGLTPEEADLYIHLLSVKSATVQEIHSSASFKGKQRSNLYKVLNRLVEQKMITEETKEEAGKKRFFPVEPKVACPALLERKEAELRDLQAELEWTVEALDRLVDVQKNSRFDVPEPLQPLVTLLKPTWIVKEPPEVFEKPGLGKIYSIEYNTRRVFGGDSVGIVIHQFKYAEHVTPEAITKARDHELSGFMAALDAIKDQGPVKMKDYWSEDGVIDGLQYTKIHTRLTIPGKFAGGIATFILAEMPEAIVSVWGADLADFQDAISRLSAGFTLSQAVNDLAHEVE